MPRDYWHCPDCNGNFDHGEKCDCQVKKAQNISDCLIIGVDIPGDRDIACLQVARREGDGLRIINTLYGEDAELAYGRLFTNIKV